MVDLGRVRGKELGVNMIKMYESLKDLVKY